MSLTKNYKLKTRVYLDNAAATPLDSAVKREINFVSEKFFGNPSSIYEEGRLAKKILEEARKKIANIINALSEEIIFTSGGTEGNNLAIFGIATAKEKKGRHLITSKIEHPSVLNCFKELEKRGFETTYLNVDKNGFVNPKELKSAIRKDTILVSIIYANHEIGVIQPISEMSKIIKTANPDTIFHLDACQASNYLDLNVEKLAIDLMTVNGSKIYGPKGAGFLYIRKGVNIKPLFFGGEQEKRLRPGTENIPLIAGFAKALEVAEKIKNSESKRLSLLRDYFIKKILSSIPQTALNGDKKQRLPNNVNVSIYGIEGEAAVLHLDGEGVACSTGSACTSEKLEPSHIITALGLPYEFSHGSLRFTLGRNTTKKDIDYTLKKLQRTVKILRQISAIRSDVAAFDVNNVIYEENFAAKK